WGPEKRHGTTALPKKQKHRYLTVGRSKQAKLVSAGSAATPFGVPMRGAEQRRLSGGSRLALSEPQASLASRPDCRVAQGTGQRPAPTLGSPFLWLLSFGEAKESTPALKAENSRQTIHPLPARRSLTPNKRHQPHKKTQQQTLQYIARCEFCFYNAKNQLGVNTGSRTDPQRAKVVLLNRQNRMKTNLGDKPWPNRPTHCLTLLT
ncbi:MAG: hypothetical protein WAW48_10475, partial [Azonexus sp.]